MSQGHAARKLRHLIRISAPGLLVLRRYRPSWLPSDVAAGLSVAAIALPVGIAYSDLAGVPPVIGMYSAIFPLFAYALFGSSRQLMTGPDAATCILVAATLAPLAGGDPERYAVLLLGLTTMTGVLYLLAGAGKLGFIANFLSQPILTGYLNGIALLIIVGQLPKLLGYSGTEEAFHAKVIELFEHVGQSHWPTAALGFGMLVILVLVMRFLPRLPGAFVVVVLSIVLVAVLGLQERGVAILGEVPSGLPSLALPPLDPTMFRDLLGAASGLVLVSFTSGVLTAKSFARRNGYEINANLELIGFGACNLASGLAQGFPVTGADSRTAVNNAMGGKTQVAGLVAGGAMLLVLLFMTAPLVYVPTTALAAVILVSAVGLFDGEEASRALLQRGFRPGAPQRGEKIPLPDPEAGDQRVPEAPESKSAGRPGRCGHRGRAVRPAMDRCRPVAAGGTARRGPGSPGGERTVRVSGRRKGTLIQKRQLTASCCAQAFDIARPLAMLPGTRLFEVP